VLTVPVSGFGLTPTVQPPVGGQAGTPASVADLISDVIVASPLLAHTFAELRDLPFRPSHPRISFRNPETTIAQSGQRRNGGVT